MNTKEKMSELQSGGIVMVAYHFCREDLTSPNAPKMVWKVGQTRTMKGKIVPCKRGFHASPSLWDALPYAPGPIACLVELGGTIIPHGDDKFAASSRKLLAAVDVSKELRLFAADCAEHVIHLFEREYPNDDRPRKAIEAARAYAEGEIDKAAAWAAGDAALDAARDAGSAGAAWAAGSAALAAAGDASMATFAAGDAARAKRDDARAEREWQRTRFDQRFGHLFSEEAPC